MQNSAAKFPENDKSPVDDPHRLSAGSLCPRALVPLQTTRTAATTTTKVTKKAEMNVEGRKVVEKKNAIRWRHRTNIGAFHGCPRRFPFSLSAACFTPRTLMRYAQRCALSDRGAGERACRFAWRDAIVAIEIFMRDLPEPVYPLRVHMNDHDSTKPSRIESFLVTLFNHFLVASYLTVCSFICLFHLHQNVRRLIFVSRRTVRGFESALGGYELSAGVR